jgi:HK97 family phage portal protein
MDQQIVGHWVETKTEFDPPADQDMHLTSGMENPQDWLVRSIGGAESWSGQEVNGQTVLSSGPVYQAVNIIASTLAMLPMEVNRKTADDSIPIEDHPIDLIFNHHGNDEMLPFHVRQTIVAQGLIHGNAFAAIHFQGGVPVGIYPLRSGSVTLDRVRLPGDAGQVASGPLIYVVTTDQGESETLFPHEIYHYKLMGSGLWGASPLGLFSNTFGNGIAYERVQGRMLANDARPGGVLQTPGVLRPDQVANLRREWYGRHGGMDNTNTIALLQDGVTWHPMTLSNKDAEMLDTRKFYREEVAAIYNVPPHMLGALESSSVRANIEAQDQAFVRQTLSPHDSAISQEAKEKLSTARERLSNDLSVHHNFKALLRGDIETRFDSYVKGRSWGFYSVNEIRSFEDMRPIDEGDQYLVPLNMADAETGEPVGGTPDPQATPGESSAPTGEDDDDQELMAPRDAIVMLRDKLDRIQSQEVTALARMLEGKKNPYADEVPKYYDRFSGYLTDELTVLDEIAGFRADRDEIVKGYADASAAAVGNIETHDQLLTTVKTWSGRIDSLIKELQSCD